MDAPATITISRRAMEEIIECLIELIDVADRLAAIDVNKTTEDKAGQHG